MNLFGKVLIKYASVQVLSNLIRLVSGFVVVRLLDPEIYGQFSGVSIYLGYILIGQGGLINGLSRELPFELGRNNDSYAKELASSVFIITIILSILSGLVFLSISVYFYLISERLTSLIFFAYSIIAGLHLFNKQYLPTLYRTNKDFNSLSKQNILVGLSNLVSVLFVWFFGIYGLMIRGVVLVLFEFYLLFKNKPYELQYKIEFIHVKKLFKVGLPIFVVGHVNPLWMTIINNFIFATGGALNYGLYALSTIVQNAMGVIPKSVSQIVYPRMATMLGEGHDLKTILKTNIRALFFQFMIILTLSLLSSLCLPFIIPIILPKYSDGIVAAQWMFFVPVVQSFGALNNLFNVVKKQKFYFLSLLLGALLGSTFIYLKYQTTGFKLEIFPQGLILGIAIQQITSMFFLFKIVNEFKRE